ncbi:MAG TPA: thioredoxin domain-containing protein, partial [Planctomycetaceae bacterium]|nr:thioredoxin domain-containing protein [Planctomycetaceae bacterium]
MRTTLPNDREPLGQNNRSLKAANERWSLVATVLMTVAAAMLILLGCSLPEGDADSTPPEGHGKGPTNRLSRETSPYLLAHARNPVDWYPWGPEALEKARKEEKPIFLSIGYSSCHWCHVMEQKVFSDPEIARYMNDHFVNIKVDREERPDIDDIYMTALQMYFQAIKSTQTGGWPLSIFLTPDGRPLGGGTYFPPQDEQGRTGFPTLMKKVVESWRDNRRQMETNADILADAVRQASRPRAALTAPKLDRDLLGPVLKSLEAGYDAEYGGFGFDRRSPDRPKFPVPVKLALLQYETKRHNDERAGKMLYDTLDRMAAGGIYDHVGGGFHRYSTDRFWRVPHFEKMLYDNAQLADVYAEAYRHTGQIHYRDIAESTIEFVFRELTDPRGAFYSALDADSEGAEGKYYVWTGEELAATLSPEELDLCKVVYGTEGSPRFELGHVLEQVIPIDTAASKLKRPAVELERELKGIRQKLLSARQKRTAPARDDKILTSWNGLMIRTLARAGVIFEKPAYVQAGAKAAEFLLTELRDDKGRLCRSYRAGQARVGAYLDDYA